jgi:glucosamine--fructose-6-phosphate aminotransferase (isomerizing)
LLGHYESKNENAYHEIKSRNATTIVITDDAICRFAENEHMITIPYNETFSHILAVIPLQMLAYQLSASKGLNPDMPKNLAKVVTVE